MERGIYGKEGRKVMRVEGSGESNVEEVCVMLMFVVI